MEKQLNRCTFSLIVTLLLASCDAKGPRLSDTAALDSIDGGQIRAHMTILASDDMHGREAGTAGYDKAADYVAGQFRESGLDPIGRGRGFFQPIEFLESRLVTESASLILQKGDTALQLALRDDFVCAGGYGPASEEITAPLVFVGYGISAPEYEHDDFEGVDVKGKILVVLSGAPPRFDTDQRAFYSSNLVKQELATGLAAVGLIAVRTPVDQELFAWDRYLSAVGTPGMRWNDAEGNPHEGFSQLVAIATMSEPGAAKLFALSGHDLEDIFLRFAAGETGSFDMGITATFARTSLQRVVTSSNVLGVLKGSDPVLRNEYVVYTAHLDHLGVRPDDEGDQIYNGAYDNAAGVAAILEIAKAMASMEPAPRRSILFAAVTAQEKGLRGSSYLARNPPVPIGSLVANINIDMPYLGFPLADIEAFGAEHSSLLAATVRAAGQTGLILTPDPVPEQVRFVRSDQFSFVKEGIPSLAFKSGSRSSDPGIDGSAMLGEFLKQHYHRANDDMDQAYSVEGARRFVQAALMLGMTVADQDARPRWNEGDFFGEKFGQQ